MDVNGRLAFRPAILATDGITVDETEEIAASNKVHSKWCYFNLFVY